MAIKIGKILIVEDEVKIARLIYDYLKAQRHCVETVYDGAAVTHAFTAFKPDIILLDLMLPNKSGETLCREIRAQSDVGIIILSAKTEEHNRLQGLSLGADDYICKPFSANEVVARVEVLLRRMPAIKQNDALPLALDESDLALIVQGERLRLTPSEYRLLTIMLEHPERVYARSYLVDRLHDDFRDISERAVDCHIKNLRKKITHLDPHFACIKSVYGFGYKFQFDSRAPSGT